MVSRKRNQGKARKAAKAREEAEERRNNQATNVQQQQQLPVAQMQTGNMPISRREIPTCGHGAQKIDNICTNFVISFRVAARAGTTIFKRLTRARKFTMVEYSDVWNNSAKMEMVLSFFLYNGARQILYGNNDSARDFAMYARYFEQYAAVELHKTQALISWPKINEAYTADEHTLVKFFRVRIPCSCLDKKYEEVKSITKIGTCYNNQCSLPKGMVQRSKTMYCSRCRGVTYCSRGCQKADWKKHKEICNEDAAIKSEFDAKKQP